MKVRCLVQIIQNEWQVEGLNRKSSFPGPEAFRSPAELKIAALLLLVNISLGFT